MSESASARYVMGPTDGERRRLALQASILEPFTEHLFRRAGISPAEAMGVEGAAGLDIETLTDSLREESRVTGASAPGPLMFGCFARRP